MAHPLPLQKTLKQSNSICIILIYAGTQTPTEKKGGGGAPFETHTENPLNTCERASTHQGNCERDTPTACVLRPRHKQKTDAINTAQYSFPGNIN